MCLETELLSPSGRSVALRGDAGRDHPPPGAARFLALPVLTVGNAAAPSPGRVGLLCFCASIAFKQITAFSSTSSPALFTGSSLSELWLGPTSS